MSSRRRSHRDDDRSRDKRRRSRSRSRSRDRGRDRGREGRKKDAVVVKKAPVGERDVMPVVATTKTVAVAVAVPAFDPEEEELRRIEEKLRLAEEEELQRVKAAEEAKRRREEIVAKWAAKQPDQLPPQVRIAVVPEAVVITAPVPNHHHNADKDDDDEDDDDDGDDDNDNHVVSPLAVPALDDNDGDDLFDMFADTADLSGLTRAASKAQLAQTEIRTDAEGYGSITAGRVLGGRYQVIGEAGKGVFSTVVRCHDLQQGGAEVVVKVARMNEAMKRAGRKEIEYLRLLTKRDPENKFCTLRMLDSFEDQDFLCVVLEAMDISLRETVYLYGQGQGLSMAAVRYYGKRVLMALYHMKQCGLVHTDLKLDNLLVDKHRKVLKVADFGSTRRIAEFVKGKAEELCPLWYRPPEVIVAYPYMSYSLDIWCFGNILYELATGTVLFQGNNLNEQLKMYIEMFGRLPKKMVTNAEAYFYNGDPAKFLWLQVDTVTGRSLTSIVDMSREPHLSLKEKLFDFFPDAKGEERKSVVQLHDLIEKCLTLNPRKRISTEEALNHPFWISTKR